MDRRRLTAALTLSRGLHVDRPRVTPPLPGCGCHDADGDHDSDRGLR